MNPDEINTIRTHIEQAHADGRPGEVPGDEVLALIDHAEQLAATLDRVRSAKSRLFAALIASSHLLGKPYTNAPATSPWKRSIAPRMAALDEALGVPTAVRVKDRT